MCAVTDTQRQLLCDRVFLFSYVCFMTCVRGGVCVYGVDALFVWVCVRESVCVVMRHRAE